MSSNFLHIGVATFGAAIQEVAYWYDLRGKLEDETYSALLGSWKYRIVTALMIIGSGIGTAIWYYDEPSQSLRSYLILGAAFPLILKKAISVLLSNQNVLGAERSSARELARAYFRQV